jgi:hypothetical protein
VVHRVADCVRDGVWPVIPQPTEWKRIGNQINAAPIPEKFNAFLSRVASKKSASSINRSRPLYENKTISLGYPHPRQPQFFNRNASDERLYYKRTVKHETDRFNAFVRFAEVSLFTAAAE